MLIFILGIKDTGECCLKALFSSHNLGAAFISAATVHPDQNCLGREAQGSLFRDHVLPYQPSSKGQSFFFFLCQRCNTNDTDEHPNLAVFVQEPIPGWVVGPFAFGQWIVLAQYWKTVW